MTLEVVVTGFAIINHAKHTDSPIRHFVYLNANLDFYVVISRGFTTGDFIRTEF